MSFYLEFMGAYVESLMVFKIKNCKTTGLKCQKTLKALQKTDQLRSNCLQQLKGCIR